MPVADRDALTRLAAEVEYPITRDRLIEEAAARGLDADELRRALGSTPIERFNSPNDLLESFAKMTFPGP